jgi:phage-related minor tail protein
MPDGVQKTAAAVAVFGRSGADLIPLLNGGAEAMDKFTYKVSNDFSARSELFNDTITILGFKTQGFGLELTDALLPALQSILEVFGDLFSTDQDWTALFEVIKFGLRSVATVLFATIKLVDVFVKTIVYSFDAIGKALQGDFQGAGRALSQGFGAGMEQAKRDFQQIGKLFTDAAPGTGSGRRTGRGLDLDTSSEDKKAAAASKAAASDAKRRQTLTQKAIDLQKQLRRSVEDTRDAFDVLGASPTQQLALARDTALLESKRNLDDLTKSVVDLSNEVTQAGGKFDFKPFVDLLNQLGRADAELAKGAFQQGLKDLLPSLEDYDAKIAEVKRGTVELTEVQKLDNEILKQKYTPEILAFLELDIAKRRELAQAIDEATAAQKTFNGQFGTSFQAGIKSMGDLGANLGSSFASAFQGMADQLTDFVTTGKASFGDFARSVLKDLSNILIKFALFQTLKAIVPSGSAFGKFLGFADGAAFAQNGIQPFARGGIVDRPTLFPFANGTGLMGEAGPEAIIPLKRGRDGKLGVAGGGGGTTNVVVNVDASGSSVEGDQAQAKALGNAISAAVQSELVKQKRPGGLLA